MSGTGAEAPAARLRSSDSGLRRSAASRTKQRTSSHSRLGVKPHAMPEMITFWMLEVPSTICSDLASR